MDNIKYLYETEQQVKKYIDRPISLILKEIIKKEIKNSSNILDFGCGDGKILKYIMSKKKGCKGIGIDFSSVLIEEANQVPLKDIQFINADFMGFQSKKKFDIILIIGTMGALADNYQESVDKVKMLMKENGKIILSFYDSKETLIRNMLWYPITLEYGTFISPKNLLKHGKIIKTIFYSHNKIMKIFGGDYFYKFLKDKAENVWYCVISKNDINS